MTRLTNALRNQIVNNAIEKAGIPDREEALRGKRSEWAEQVRVEALGGKDTERKIRALEKRLKKSVEGLSLPSGVTELPVFHRDYDIGLNVAGQQFRAYFSGHLVYTDGCADREHVKITLTRYTISAENPLAEIFTVLEKERASLDELRESVDANVRGALSGVNTVKQLLEAWPEAKELLPVDLSPAKIALPAVQTDSLNALIGLPSDGG